MEIDPAAPKGTLQGGVRDLVERMRSALPPQVEVSKAEAQPAVEMETAAAEGASGADDADKLCIKVCVRDTGIGISTEDREAIFLQYTKGSHTSGSDGVDRHAQALRGEHRVHDRDVLRGRVGRGLQHEHARLDGRVARLAPVRVAQREAERRGQHGPPQAVASCAWTHMQP